MGEYEDFRRASEPELINAIRDGQAMALAEAYHRLIPASHAVARRLVSTPEVEPTLRTVFAQLWEQPPVAGPLEAWVRRTTWAVCADRLRAEGQPPASPSAAALLPDLPAPEVRFLDAAERAIAELPDDERRALLLAHDKGVPTDSQDPGAADALVRAMLALAGPETSTGDRSAMEEDVCADLDTMGDWCLGIADNAATTAIDEAIGSRPGCAAKSRALRRGRRRIEGLPATPDTGQRVLVAVITTSQRAATASPQATAAVTATTSPPTQSAEEAAEEALAEPVEESPADASQDAPLEGQAVLEETGELPKVDQAAEGDSDEEDPFAELDEPADLAGAAGEPALAPGADAMVDTADLPAADAAAEATTDQDWKPTPGDTSELRLSDILADDSEEEDDDDPFAGLDAPAEPAEPAAGPAGGDPYASLQDLDDQAAPPLAPEAVQPAAIPPADPNVYVEGQEDRYAEPAGAPPSQRSALAAVLAWVLPILGGLAVGVLLAVQVFGAPS